MKKALVSILATLYLATSMGATVHLHYCMGKLVAWGFIKHSSGDCAFCGMKIKGIPDGYQAEMKTCCHDETRQYKNVNDQKAGPDCFKILSASQAPVAPDLRRWLDVLFSSPAFSGPVSHSPPDTGPIPVFLRNCNFRI